MPTYRTIEAAIAANPVPVTRTWDWAGEQMRMTEAARTWDAVPTPATCPTGCEHDHA